MIFGPKFKTAISSLFLLLGVLVYLGDYFVGAGITLPPIIYKALLSIGVFVRAWKDLPDLDKDGIPDLFQVSASK